MKRLLFPKEPSLFEIKLIITSNSGPLRIEGTIENRLWIKFEIGNGEWSFRIESKKNIILIIVNRYDVTMYGNSPSSNVGEMILNREIDKFLKNRKHYHG